MCALQAILGVIQYQMDTGPLSAAALAGALHRLGAAFQNNDGGGRGRGRQGPASKSAVTSHRTFIALKAECGECGYVIRPCTQTC